MDVRGTQLHRALDDQVDQADHRRLAGAVAQLFDVLHRLLLGRLDPREDVAHLALALAVHALDGGIDFRAERHPRDDPAAAGQGQRIQHEMILRIGHGHQQLAVVKLQGQRAAFLEKAIGQALGQQRCRGKIAGGDPGQTQQLRQLLGDVLLGNQAQAVEQGRQGLPLDLPGLHAQDPVVVSLGQAPGLDQGQPEIERFNRQCITLCGKHSVPASGSTYCTRLPRDGSTPSMIRFDFATRSTIDAGVRGVGSPARQHRWQALRHDCIYSAGAGRVCPYQPILCADNTEIRCRLYPGPGRPSRRAGTHTTC